MNTRLIAVTIAVALIVTAVSLVGCSNSSSSPSPTVAPAVKAEDDASRAACLAAMQAAQTELHAWTAQGNTAQGAATVQELADIGAISKSLACPAGGSYTYSPVAEEFSCSIHGRVSD